MRTLWTIVTAAVLAVGLLAGPASAQEPNYPADPGLIPAAGSEVSDQKKGSVLFYNFVTSNASDPGLEDTRLTLTNNSETSAAFVRLFFVNGTTGAVSNKFQCLTATQTTSIQVSDVAPGFRGYVVAVAVDGVLGCPTRINTLTGQAHVKIKGGFRSAVNAVAAAALNNVPSVCDANSATAELRFDGVNYNRLPRTIAADNIPSNGDAAATFLVVNRVGGNLATNAANLGSLTGQLFDDAENVFGWSLLNEGPQVARRLTNQFPVTTPNFTSVIPAGHTGWTKFAGQVDVPLLGTAFYKSYPAPGAVNLRILTLTPSGFVMVPVDPPSC